MKIRNCWAAATFLGMVLVSQSNAQENLDESIEVVECGGNYQALCESGCRLNTTPYLDMCFTTDLEGYPVFCGASDGRDACSEIAMRAFQLEAPCATGMAQYQNYCYAVNQDGFPSLCGYENNVSCNAQEQAYFEVDACAEGLIDVDGMCSSSGDIQERGRLADKAREALINSYFQMC